MATPPIIPAVEPQISSAAPPTTTNVTDRPSDQERQKVIGILEQWSDEDAKRIVCSDFDYDERYRFMNHDRRFRTSDEMYLAYVQKRTWEDTKIPRSSLPVWLAFQQVEALIPAVVDALMSETPPFDVMPHADGTWHGAFMVRELLRHQMDGLDENGLLSLREVICQMLKSSLIYGNGILEFGWCVKQGQRIEYTRKMVPRMAPVYNSMTGQGALMPSGQYDIQVTTKPVSYMVNKPIVCLTDIRDFYIDPHCPTWDVQMASHCETRQFLKVEELAQYRGLEGYNIPDDATLRQMAAEKPTTYADQTKMQQETFRGNYWTPQYDYTDDPAQKRIELIRYWRKNRHVWLLNRKWVAHNQPNCYGCLPFINMVYTNVLGRFYGLSIPDLVEGDQRLGEALLNARVDEVNLNVHPPIVRRRGMQIPASARRLRPGVIWEVDGDPSRDVVRMQMGNVTQDAHIEFDALERRTQKTTGITDTGMAGIATAGGNSANRTATGINTQTSAAGRRVQFLVESWEDRFLVPLCNVLLSLNKRFLLPEQILQVLGPDGQQLDIDPIEILNSSVRFEVKSSDKMRARGAMAGGFQIIMETLANPAFLEQQAKQGYQLNTPVLVDLMADVFGIRSVDLFIPLQPGTQQSMNQPSADQVLRMQMQKERLAAQQNMASDQQDTDLMNTMMGKFITPDVAHEAMGLEPPAAIKAKHQPPPRPKGPGRQVMNPIGMEKKGK